MYFTGCAQISRNVKRTQVHSMTRVKTAGRDASSAKNYLRFQIVMHGQKCRDWTLEEVLWVSILWSFCDKKYPELNKFNYKVSLMSNWSIHSIKCMKHTNLLKHQQQHMLIPAETRRCVSSARESAISGRILHIEKCSFWFRLLDFKISPDISRVTCINVLILFFCK